MSGRVMRVYKCRICGQPKAGHVCTGSFNPTASAPAPASSLPVAQVVPVSDQSQLKRRRVVEDDTDDEDAAQGPPLDIKSILVPHIEEMKAQIMTSLQPVMTSAASAASAALECKQSHQHVQVPTLSL